MKAISYLDHNATTPLLPAAKEAMLEALEHGWGNPSSAHQMGRLAAGRLAQARDSVACSVGAAAGQVTFVSGATEAINHVVNSVGPGRVFASAVEHPAVLAAVQAQKQQELELLPVSTMGQVSVEQVLERVQKRPKPALVAIMAANNETGVIQPLAELVMPLRALGIPLLVDAVQLVGRQPVTFPAPDYLVVTAHKLGGPKGAGALICREGVVASPLIVGGGQEQGMRGGTEPLPAIIGFGAAMDVVRVTREAQAERLGILKELLVQNLLGALPGSQVIGRGAPVLSNTLSFMLPTGIQAHAVLAPLDEMGICVSAGSACHAGTLSPSRVLTAMGFNSEEAVRVMRISMGHDTSKQDVERLMELLPVVVAKVRR
jgi:cysteine desulfurase